MKIQIIILFNARVKRFSPVFGSFSSKTWMDLAKNFRMMPTKVYILMVHQVESWLIWEVSRKFMVFTAIHGREIYEHPNTMLFTTVWKF